MRIAISSVGFLSAILGVPWLTALCIVALALRYRSWEAILLGLCVDFLWLPLGLSMYTLPYFTVGALFVVWMFEPLRMQFLR
jgi:hypothetical protein